MSEPKPQLHQSQLSMLARCGEQYRRRYVEGEIIPPGVALHVGSATHKSVERNLRHKVKTGALLPLVDVQDSVRDDFEKRWQQEGVRLDSDEVLRGARAVKGEAIDLVVALAGLHASELAPKIEPISDKHLERKFVVELPNFPFDLAGTIDIQEKARIRDTKTAGKTPSQADVDGSEQLTMYAVGVHAIDGLQLPIEVALDALVKLKTPKAVTLTSARSNEQIGRFLRRVERAAEVIEKGMFMPAQPDSWVCSTRWCGYAETCPFWSGRP